MVGPLKDLAVKVCTLYILPQSLLTSQRELHDFKSPAPFNKLYKKNELFGFKIVSLEKCGTFVNCLKTIMKNDCN